MGRRKLEIMRIADNNARQMSFTKRRNGLLKKARELSILCDVDVAAIIFSSRGKLYNYCSTNNLTEILQRYQSHCEMGEDSSQRVCEIQEQYPRNTGPLSSEEFLQNMERELGEPRVNQLSVTDLVLLEKQIQDALVLTRSTKTQLLLDSISSLHEKEKMLEEEKRHLEEQVIQLKKKNSILYEPINLAQSKTDRRESNVIMDLNILADCQIIEQ